MAKVIKQKMNADEVAKNLWVGGLPTDSDSVDQNFDAIVLAAEEFQDAFPVHKYPGTQLIPAPLSDEPHSPTGPSNKQKATALDAALKVHKLNKDGKKVLVSCAAGVNRSSLIAGLSMVIDGMNAQHAINRIRKYRKPPTGSVPLFNKHFRQYLKEFDQELSKQGSPTH